MSQRDPTQRFRSIRPRAGQTSWILLFACLAQQGGVRALGESTPDATAAPVSAADLLERLRDAKNRIVSFVADIDVVSYDTCAYIMSDGSRAVMPMGVEDISEVVELGREEWRGPVVRRLHWEVQGERARLEIWRGEITPESGQQGTGSPVHVTYVFDGTRSMELQVSEPAGVRRGRVFPGKPRSHFHPYELCFASNGVAFVTPTIEGAGHQFESSGAPEAVCGHMTYRLALRSKLLGAVQLAVWLDPNAGWMPRQIERYYIKDTQECRNAGQCDLIFTRRYENIELAEVAPGVWFPVAAEECSLRPQLSNPNQMVLMSKSSITIKPSTLQVNQPIPADRLALNWPDGTVVADEESRSAYQVGSSAEKVMEVELERVNAQARADPSLEIFRASRGSAPLTDDVGLPTQASRSSDELAHSDKTWSWLPLLGIGCALGLISTLTVIQWIQRGR